MVDWRSLVLVSAGLIVGVVTSVTWFIAPEKGIPILLGKAIQTECYKNMGFVQHEGKRKQLIPPDGLAFKCGRKSWLIVDEEFIYDAGR